MVEKWIAHLKQELEKTVAPLTSGGEVRCMARFFILLWFPGEASPVPVHGFLSLRFSPPLRSLSLSLSLSSLNLLPQDRCSRYSKITMLDPVPGLSGTRPELRILIAMQFEFETMCASTSTETDTVHMFFSFRARFSKEITVSRPMQIHN
jgi:hypothetical protein